MYFHNAATVALIDVSRSDINQLTGILFSSKNKADKSSPAWVCFAVSFLQLKLKINSGIFV